MAITTHAQLLTAVSDYIGRRTDLGSVDDDFVVLAEARMNFGDYGGAFPTPPLRVRQMVSRDTLSPTSEYTTLPTTYLEAISAKLTSSTPDKPLVALQMATFDRECPSSSAGEPSYYAIVGTEMRIGPVQSCTIEFLNYRTIPPLASNDPNWLLTANPGVYLYGCLLEAAIYIDEVEDIAKYGNIYAGLMRGMQSSGSDSSIGKPIQAQSGIRLVQRGGIRQ